MTRVAAIGAALALLTTVGAPMAFTTARRQVALIRVPGNGIQPDAVVDPGGVLHLLYFSGEDRGGNLFYVRSNDFGVTFSNPIRVNSQEGSAIATGTIRGGQLAVGQYGRIHVVWNGSDSASPRGLRDPATGQPSAPVLYTRSSPGGQRFEPQRNLTRRSYGIDGGSSIAADAQGRVYAAWHAVAAGGANGEDHCVVWIARSDDEGTTFSEEQAASREPTGACGCCGLRLFSGRSGPLFLLYRSASSLAHRDIYLLKSIDNGLSFIGSKVQRWDIAVCPMTSMSLAASGSSMFGAWETAGHVYFGATEGASIPSPIAPPGEADTRKHPRLAANANGDLLLAWTEGTAWARGGSVAWQVFDKAGRAADINGQVPGLPVWSFAAPVGRPDGSFVILY